MDSEPQLTSPQRRYEIVGDSNDVNQQLEDAYAEKVPVIFKVNLADIITELPVPKGIISREIGMFVVRMFCDRDNGDVRAFGNTVENKAEVVTVHVPKNREKTSLLYLLDIGSTETE